MSGIKIEDVSHVSFRAPDLDAMAAFLTEFGLVARAEGGRLFARALLQHRRSGEPS